MLINILIRLCCVYSPFISISQLQLLVCIGYFHLKTFCVSTFWFSWCLNGNNQEVRVIVDCLFTIKHVSSSQATNLEHISQLSLKLDVALRLLANREVLGTDISMGNSLCFFPFLTTMQMDLGILQPHSKDIKDVHTNNSWSRMPHGRLSSWEPNTEEFCEQKINLRH